MNTIERHPGFENIYLHYKFTKEFKSMFGKSVPVQYTNWLHRRLLMLEKEGKQAVDGVSFEKLKGKEGDAGLYSIRYAKSKANPRVIYAYIGEDGECALLSAFLERDAKDYENAGKRALHRLKEIKEELE